MDTRTRRRVRDFGAVALILAGAWAFNRIADPFGVALGPESQWTFSAREPIEPDTERDLLRSGLDLSGERGGESYADFDARRDRESADNFRGYPCLGVCEGHEAGWDWAEAHSIGDAGDCGGDSWSFFEGCAIYAAEHPSPADTDRAVPALP